jgi:hypothetical protein
MIILTNTTDKIQVKIGATVTTNQLPCFASYRDTTSSTIEAKRNAINTNNTTAVDLVDSPAASTQRIVDYISVYNRDTVAQTVTVQFNDNGTLYNLCVVNLGAGEKVEYQEGKGFKVLSTTGAERVSDNFPGLLESSNVNFVLKTSDQPSIVNLPFVDITDLSFLISAGQMYWFKFVIPYTTSNITFGSKFAINGPASPTFLAYQTTNSNGAGLATVNRGLSTYDAASTSGAGVLAGNIAIVEGVIIPSSDGTLIGRFGNETSTLNTTVKAGAMVKYIQM